MAFCLFATYEAATESSAVLAKWFDSDPLVWLREQPGIINADRFVPEVEEALYFNDGAAPAVMLQIAAEEVSTIEKLVEQARFKPLFLERPHTVIPLEKSGFGVFQIVSEAVYGETGVMARTAPMSFVVRYYGPMEDMTAFHAFYVANHLPLLARFPAIRNVYAYLPVAWRNPGLPLSEVLLGNEVVFDDVAALNEAMRSDIIAELRKDSAQFPSFGHSTHHTMQRRTFA